MVRPDISDSLTLQMMSPTVLFEASNVEPDKSPEPDSRWRKSAMMGVLAAPFARQISLENEF